MSKEDIQETKELDSMEIYSTDIKTSKKPKISKKSKIHRTPKKNKKSPKTNPEKKEEKTLSREELWLQR